MSAADTPSLSEGPLGADPGRADPSSTTRVGIDPIVRADTVVKGLLLGLLDTLEANVPGACQGEDIEPLHDLRVANRRARSILGQVKEVLAADQVARFREGFVWIQQVTGPVRDLDVYLARFDGYLESLPPSLRGEMVPLRDYLLSRRAIEQTRLAEVLRSPRFQELLAAWRAFLSRVEPEERAPPLALDPIRDVVDGRIRHMAKRVRREGRAITEVSPPDELHELRKSCKKLRYLMELFQSLYPRERIVPLIKQMKMLLGALGDFQDLSVQVGHLQETAREMHAAGVTTPGVLIGTGVLVGELYDRQNKARTRCAEAFLGFDNAKQWREYRSLFWAAA